MKNKEEKIKIFWKATGIILIVAVLLSIPITICCVLTSQQKAGKKSVESWCREYAIAEVFKDTENYNYGITSQPKDAFYKLEDIIGRVDGQAELGVVKNRFHYLLSSLLNASQGI